MSEEGIEKVSGQAPATRSTRCPNADMIIPHRSKNGVEVAKFCGNGIWGACSIVMTASDKESSGANNKVKRKMSNEGC